jgi:hypothetical protein
MLPMASASASTKKTFSKPWKFLSVKTFTSARSAAKKLENRNSKIEIREGKMAHQRVGQFPSHLSS